MEANFKRLFYSSWTARADKMSGLLGRQASVHKQLEQSHHRPHPAIWVSSTRGSYPPAPEAGYVLFGTAR